MSTTEQIVAVPAGTFQADAVHSSVAFEVQYMGISAFGGKVTDFEASLVDGRLTGAARIASLETKDENLHAHLMAPDFFDAEHHPDIVWNADLPNGTKALADDVTLEADLSLVAAA
jgi:polyisoprenoid-binding protein YceI